MHTANKGGTVNTYNKFDQLVTSTKGGVTTTYTYNPDGTRHSKTVGNNPTTYYLWQGDNIIAELTLAGNPTAVYTYGVNLITSTAGSTTRYYLYNAHGDVTGLADTAGTVVKFYRYDAFGNEINADPNDTNPFRYSGQYFDKETGDYYLMARYYDPANGRFTQQDDWGYANASDPLSLNLYTYCTNDPVDMFDPTGHIGSGCDTDADPSNWVGGWGSILNSPYAGYFNPDGTAVLPDAEFCEHPASIISQTSGIQLDGTIDERNIILANLQALTNDRLAMTENGMVYITKILFGNFVNGTELLERLINSIRKCTIHYWNQPNDATNPVNQLDSTNGVGTDSDIYFNPNYTPDLLATDPSTGFVVSEKSYSYVNLAHEMIHADRNARGVSIMRSKNNIVGYTYILGVTLHHFYKFSWTSYIKYTETFQMDEYATVGLAYCEKGGTNENMIRAEHGINLRGAY